MKVDFSKLLHSIGVYAYTNDNRSIFPIIITEYYSNMLKNVLLDLIETPIHTSSEIYKYIVSTINRFNLQLKNCVALSVAATMVLKIQ